MRQISCFIWQLTAHADDVDGAVDGANVDQADGAGSGLDDFENVSVGIGHEDEIFVGSDQGFQIGGVDLGETLERFGLASGSLVENYDNGFPVRSFPHFGAENLRELNAGEISNVVLFVHDYRHVVSKAGSEKDQEKQGKQEQALKFHNASVLRA